MRKAVIDLGTNTFNLCIADVSEKEINIIHSEKEGVALGMGGINQNQIHLDAIDRAIVTLEHYKKVCNSFAVRQIRAIGTSALRDATNRAVLITKAKEQLNIEIEVISGEKEAQLIHKGVAWTYKFNEKTVIMDIGGGSTEFILADQTGILDLYSLDIGLSRLIQSRDFQDPLSFDDIDYIQHWFESKANQYLSKFKVNTLVGASGSFETFYEMMNAKTFPKLYQAFELDIDHIRNVCAQLIASSQAERDMHPFIIPIRRKMAPFAAIKTLWILDLLEIQHVYVSPCALKEGALLE